MWNELGRQAEARINSTIITRTNANPQKAENFTEYKARLTVLTAPPLNPQENYCSEQLVTETGKWTWLVLPHPSWGHQKNSSLS